jgi:lipopolysaccharide/colanic/teichoic acid biosynthesis glycosyltransferase
VALLLLAPLMIGIAIAIRASSKGPIIFRQRRIGVGGRPFFICKFRSMVRDAELRRTELTERSMYADERLFKVTDDPRITAVGRWLRRTSLDELPQLFNVLMGTMSIVGPRPPLPAEVAHYEERHYTRFESKPGITGPWQVGGRNRITDFEEIVRLESAYIRRWSIWKDLDIFLRTIPAVLKMDGAH